MSIYRGGACPTCDGSGRLSCTECAGLGRIRCELCSGTGRRVVRRDGETTTVGCSCESGVYTCTLCSGGSGVCGDCGGTGLAGGAS